MLTVPVAGFLFALDAYNTMHGALVETVRHLRPDLTLETVEAMTVLARCEEAARAALPARACEPVLLLQTVQIAAVAILAISLGWLAAMRYAGRAAQRDRRLLLRLFRPGLRLTAAIGALIVIVHTGIVVACLLWLQAHSDLFLIKLVLMIVGVGGAAVISLTPRAFDTIRNAETWAHGVPLTREEAPRLWAAVDEVAARCGTRPPDHILMVVDVIFMATEVDIVLRDQRLTGRTLICSLSLARILDRRELDAIIGHELAHFAGEDCAYTVHYFPISVGTRRALAALAARRGEIGTFVALPAMALMQQFLDTFTIATNGLERDRELVADAAGARVAGSRAMATALLKSHLFGGFWTLAAHTALTMEGQIAVEWNLSEIFAQLVRRMAEPPSAVPPVDTVMANKTSHPMDDHPPLVIRLDALGVPVDDIVADAMDTAPAEPAIALLDNLEEIEMAASLAFAEGRYLSVAVASTAAR